MGGSTVMLSTFATLSVNSAKHLDAHLEMRPDNDAARLLLRSQSGRKEVPRETLRCGSG